MASFTNNQTKNEIKPWNVLRMTTTLNKENRRATCQGHEDITARLDELLPPKGSSVRDRIENRNMQSGERFGPL